MDTGSNNNNNNNKTTTTTNLMKSMSNGNEKNRDLTLILLKRILLHCWNDRYQPFSWKISLGLVSKGFFKMIQVLANRLFMNSKSFYQHYLNQSCIFKNIQDLHFSFQNLDGFLENFDQDMLEKGIWVDKVSKTKMNCPFTALEKIEIKGADTYVKNEKMALQILLSNNIATLESFSIYTQKLTLFKNIFHHLDQSTKISDIGMGFLYSDKSLDGLLGFLKMKSQQLKSFQIAFDKKSLKADASAMAALHQNLFTQHSFQQLHTLKLGHKKLQGHDFAPQSYVYPLQACTELFSALQMFNTGLLRTLRFFRDESDIKENKDFNENLFQFLQSNQSLTFLELPVQSDANLMNLIAKKSNLRKLIISPLKMVQFSTTLKELTLYELDQTQVHNFFHLNTNSATIENLTMKDYIDLSEVEDYLTYNHHLKSLKVSLKGKQQFSSGKNPFLCLADSRLIKLSFKFSSYEKPTEIINRLFRALAMNETIQYLKISCPDFDNTQSLTGDFIYHNKSDLYYYYTRSLPRKIIRNGNDSPTGLFHNSWKGLEDKLDSLNELVYYSKVKCEELNEMCITRPEYNSQYLLDYVNKSINNFQKEQWEKSDPILLCAYQAYINIKDQENFVTALIEKDFLSRDFVTEYIDRTLNSDIKSLSTLIKKKDLI